MTDSLTMADEARAILEQACKLRRDDKTATATLDNMSGQPYAYVSVYRHQQDANYPSLLARLTFPDGFDPRQVVFDRLLAYKVECEHHAAELEARISVAPAP